MGKKKSVNIDVFLDDNGRVKQLPSPNRTKIPVLDYLAGKFEKGRDYTEKEVNAVINEWHTFGDYFIMRRSLIDYGFLDRTPDGARYWVMIKAEQEEEDSDG